jgi:protein gp37
VSSDTKIEWCDHTFNPWWGCQEISPGCDHCYAKRLDKRTGGTHWGPDAERRRTSETNWKLPRRWNDQYQAFHNQHGRRQRVFCASMADVFDNRVPVEWRMDLFSLIADTPHLDWLLLTKRIGNVMPMCSGDSLMFDVICERVWLGATVVNQEEADRDIPKLLAVPAAKRFLSMEPLLGPVALTNIRQQLAGGSYTEGNVLVHKSSLDRGRPRQALDWVIVGGESGPSARPMSIQWARSLRDQCAAAGVPFLFKQWGDWAPYITAQEGEPGRFALNWPGEQHWSFIEYSPRQFIMFGATGRTTWAGKKAAGRLLDGITHDGFPS